MKLCGRLLSTPQGRATEALRAYETTLMLVSLLDAFMYLLQSGRSPYFTIYATLFVRFNFRSEFTFTPKCTGNCLGR